MKPGDKITDGTVTWTARDIRGGGGNPAGTIIAFSGNRALPEGYLLCDGSAVSRTDYAALFAVIGETYGAGDGSTTFNIPNLQNGRMLQGVISSASVGQYVSPGLPNIWGAITDGVAPGPTASGAFSITGPGPSTLNGSPYRFQNFDFDASRCSSLYGASTTVQPRALNVRFLIKY